MNKEQLIKKIGDVVMKNSKQGKLTTTKFVGTYEYKSGYDTYFAVSIDLEKVLVVYSYYQNDRGEHIDTITYKLADLPEEEVQKIYDNLNTEDKDILNYVGWTETEDKNLEIIKHIGIYTPKPKKVKQLSVDDIPELENKDDAYIVDRDNNIRILKCAGKSPVPGGRKVFEVEKNYDGKYKQPLYDNKTYSFCETGKYKKNKGIFGVVLLSGDMSDDKYLFVPNKKELIKLIERTNTIKTFYLIDKDTLYSTSKEFETDYKVDDRYTSFGTKQEAVAFFNKAKEDKLKSLTSLKQELEDKIAKAKESTNGVELLEYRDVHILHTDAKPGQKYYIYYDKKYYGPYTVTKVKNGITYLDGGFALGNWERLITPEDCERFKASEKFKKVSDYIDNALRELRYVEGAINTANSIVPFVKTDNYIPNWIEKDAEEFLKKHVPALKTVNA